ncbi:MAG TPA: hypothetical protein VGO48_07465 [Conexibacter sp.]|nr:hypothetical protein [Conexibacter sp.]
MILIALASAVLLSAIAGQASAGRLSITIPRWRATFPSLEITSGLATTRCAVTLEGSFDSRTINKTPRSLTGLITRAIAANPCAVGGLTFLAETLPWHQTWESFSGTLPRPGLLRRFWRWIRPRIREPTFGVECLANGSTEADALRVRENIEAGEAFTTLVIEGSMETSCGARATFAGTSNNYSTPESGAAIRVRLI